MASTTTTSTWTITGTTAKAKIGNDTISIKGLKSGLTISKDKASIVSGDTNIALDSLIKHVAPTATASGGITLSSALLGVTDVTIDKKLNYALAVEDSVKATVNSATWTMVESDGNKTGVAKLTANKVAAGYSVLDEGKTVRYSDEQTNKVLAVVGGLNSTGADFTNFPTVESGVITLGSGMVDTTDVSVFKGDYTLDIKSDTTNKIDAPTLLSGENSTEWVINGTTAYLVGTVTAGFTYDTVNPGFADYHPAERIILASLTGLQGGITTAGLPAITALPEIDTANGNTVKTAVEIKLGEVALGEGSVTLTSAKSYTLGDKKVTINGAGYKLAITNTGTSDTVRTATVAAHQWVDKGATISYETGTNDYYTVQGGSVIEYHPAALKEAFKLVGINDTVSVSSGYDNTISAGITLSGGNDTVITLDKNALAKTDVTLSGSGYTLKALEGNADSVPAVTTSGDAYWKISGKTASYNQDYSDGYTLKGALLDYIEPETKGIATIAGLASNIAIKSDDNKQIGTYDGNTFTKGIATLDDSGKTFRLYSNVLGTTGVTLTNASDLAVADKYKLKLNIEGTNTVQVGAPTAKDTWFVKGTSATYQNVTGAYYSYGTDSLTVGYTPETVNTTYLTISGLKEGLTVDGNGKITGIATEGTVEVNDEENKYLTQTFTLSKSVLTSSNVKLTRATGITTEYSMSLDDGTDAQVSTEFLYFKGKAASIVSGTTEGWTVADDGLNINYVAAVPNEAKATITGLAKPVDSSNVTLNDTNVVVLQEDVLPTKETLSPVVLINAEESSYNLKLADGISSQSTNNKSWSVSGTTATFTNTDSAYYSGNNSTEIKYHAPTVTSAKVKGLVSGLTVGTTDKTKLFNAEEEAVNVSDTNINLLKPALNKKNVTLESTGASYKLQLAGDTNPLEVGDTPGTVVWSVNNGTATGSVIGTVASYKRDSDTLVSYAAAVNDSTKAISITGLSKTAKAVDGVLPGINVSIPTAEATLGAIKITDSSLLPTSANSAVALGSSTKNYKLYIDEDKITRTGFANETWDFSGLTSGAATYKGDITAGYSVSTDGTKISYTAASTKPVDLAKVTGLKKTINALEAIDGIEINSAEKSFALDKNILDATDTKLTTTHGYKLNDANASEADDPVLSWTFSGTTAEYNKVTLGTYEVDTVSYTTLKYTKPTSENLVKITGLEKKNLRYAADGVIEGIWSNDTSKKVVLANEGILGTKEVALTSTGYTLDTAATGSVISTPDAFATYVELKSGKANIKQNRQAGYTISDNKLTYAKAATGTVVADLTGLNKNVTATESFEGIRDKGIDISLHTADGDKDTITLDNRILTTSNVEFNKTGSSLYQLAVATTGDNKVETETLPAANFWDVSGGKAILKNGINAYYTPAADGKSIAYTAAASVSPILTVSGLLKTATAADMIVPTDKTVALTKQVLDTSKAGAKVTLKMDKNSKDSYTLRLYGSDTTTYATETDASKKPTAVSYAEGVWTVDAKGTGILKADITTAGYDVSGGTTAVYTSDKDKKGNQASKTLATLKNLKPGSTGPEVSGSVITLAAKDLIVDSGGKGKKVTLGKNDPYTLALADDVPKATAIGDTTIAKKEGANKLTVTASGGVTEDYTLSDTKTVNYTKNKAAGKSGVVIASVTGLVKKDFAVTEEDQSAIEVTPGGSRKDTGASYTKISFTEGQVDITKGVAKTKVSAGGIGYGFEFNTGGIQIVGTKDNDILLSNGGGVSITPGKGNDYVELGYSGGNTYIYAKGDGNDYIYGFDDSSDVIQLTGIKDINAAKPTEVTIEANGNDAVLWVGTSSITLKDMASSDIQIAGKNGSIKAYNTDSASEDLLSDDNFITSSGSELSELIKPASESYTPYDFNSSSLQLTKEDKFMTQLTYTSNKK